MEKIDLSQYVGPRSGKRILEGKHIRQENGFDIFEDYFTDSSMDVDFYPKKNTNITRNSGGNCNSKCVTYSSQTSELKRDAIIVSSELNGGSLPNYAMQLEDYPKSEKECSYVVDNNVLIGPEVNPNTSLIAACGDAESISTNNYPVKEFDLLQRVSPQNGKKVLRSKLIKQDDKIAAYESYFRGSPKDEELNLNRNIGRSSNVKSATCQTHEHKSNIAAVSYEQDGGSTTDCAMLFQSRGYHLNTSECSRMLKLPKRYGEDHDQNSVDNKQPVQNIPKGSRAPIGEWDKQMYLKQHTVDNSLGKISHKRKAKKTNVNASDTAVGLRHLSHQESGNFIAQDVSFANENSEDKDIEDKTEEGSISNCSQFSTEKQICSEQEIAHSGLKNGFSQRKKRPKESRDISSGSAFIKSIHSPCKNFVAKDIRNTVHAGKNFEEKTEGGLKNGILPSSTEKQLYLEQSIAHNSLTEISKRKQIVRKANKYQSPETDTIALRRSSRTCYKPLDFWRNERLCYKFTKSGGIESLGLQSGSKDCLLYNAPNNLKNHDKKKKKIEVKHKKSCSSDFKPGLSIIDAETKNKSKAKIISEFKSLVWKNAESRVSGTSYSVAKAFCNETCIFGYVKIKAMKSKPERYISGCSLYFVILQGTLEVIIHKTVTMLQEGDSFLVPDGNLYSIKNLSDFDCLLSYMTTTENMIV